MCVYLIVLARISLIYAVYKFIMWQVENGQFAWKLGSQDHLVTVDLYDIITEEIRKIVM